MSSGFINELPEEERGQLGAVYVNTINKVFGKDYMKQMLEREGEIESDTMPATKGELSKLAGCMVQITGAVLNILTDMDIESRSRKKKSGFFDELGFEWGVVTGASVMSIFFILIMMTSGMF